MNHITKTFQFDVEPKQVRDVAAALLHSVLFFRTHGDVRPNDHDCENIDLTFAMVGDRTSTLARRVDDAALAFERLLLGPSSHVAVSSAAGGPRQGAPGPRQAQLVLSFFQMVNVGYIWSKLEKNIWEQWVFTFRLRDPAAKGLSPCGVRVGALYAPHKRRDSAGHAVVRAQLSAEVRDALLDMAAGLIREQPYLPAAQAKGKSDVFDDALREKPFLHDITMHMGTKGGPSIVSVVRHMVTEGLQQLN